MRWRPPAGTARWLRAGSGVSPVLDALQRQALDSRADEIRASARLAGRHAGGGSAQQLERRRRASVPSRRRITVRTSCSTTDTRGQVEVDAGEALVAVHDSRDPVSDAARRARGSLAPRRVRRGPRRSSRPELAAGGRHEPLLGAEVVGDQGLVLAGPRGDLRRRSGRRSRRAFEHLEAASRIRSRAPVDGRPGRRASGRGRCGARRSSGGPGEPPGPAPSPRASSRATSSRTRRSRDEW